MPIQIYNSLTKKKEPFIPLEDKKVRMYSCGVTVYDDCHIGHARSVYIFDVITRYLRYRGYDVHFVRNITDVDDKIINKAKELKKTSDEVATVNIKTYERDLKSLGVNLADIEPRATDNIPEMIAHIQALIKNGSAYASNGDVYFSVRKFKEYGKLSGQSIERMLEGVRIDPNEKKEDPLDFALWKKSAADDPGWESPWGRGRPGWHIECTCMSLKYLKCNTLDIHAGGRDLIFPHHENEIAQAEALTHKPFAKYWIHHGLLTINAQKMSKSLGNFITIQDALKKHHVNDLKIFFLFSHYASPIDYSEKKMEEAHKAAQKFDILFWKAAEILKGKQPLPIKMDFIDRHLVAFMEAMDDDFNTPQSLASLFNLISDTNKFIDEGKKDGQYEGVIYHAVDILENLSRQVLGLFTNETQNDLNEEQLKLIEERKNARLNKDFKKSDDLRDLLKEQGIVVEDTKDGQTWRWA